MDASSLAQQVKRRSRVGLKWTLSAEKSLVSWTWKVNLGEIGFFVGFLPFESGAVEATTPKVLVSQSPLNESSGSITVGAGILYCILDNYFEHRGSWIDKYLDIEVIVNGEVASPTVDPSLPGVAIAAPRPIVAAAPVAPDAPDLKSPPWGFRTSAVWVDPAEVKEALPEGVPSEPAPPASPWGVSLRRVKVDNSAGAEASAGPAARATASMPPPAPAALPAPPAMLFSVPSMRRAQSRIEDSNESESALCYICDEEDSPMCDTCGKNVCDSCKSKPRHTKQCKAAAPPFICPAIELPAGLDFVKAPAEFPVPDANDLNSVESLFAFLGPVFMDCIRARLPPRRAIEDLLSTWATDDRTWVVRVESKEAHEQWGCGRGPQGYFVFRATATSVASQYQVTVTPASGCALPTTELWTISPAGMTIQSLEVVLNPVEQQLRSRGLPVAGMLQLTNWDILLAVLQGCTEPWMVIQVIAWWAKQGPQTPLPFVITEQPGDQCRVMLATHLVLSKLDHLPLVLVLPASKDKVTKAIDLAQSNLSIKFHGQIGNHAELISTDTMNVVFSTAGLHSDVVTVALELASAVIVVGDVTDVFLVPPHVWKGCCPDTPHGCMGTDWVVLAKNEWPVKLPQLSVSSAYEKQQRLLSLNSIGIPVVFHAGPVEFYVAMQKQLSQITLVLEEVMDGACMEQLVQAASTDALWTILGKPRFGVSLSSLLWQPQYAPILSRLQADSPTGAVSCANAVETVLLLSTISQAAVAAASDRQGYGHQDIDVARASDLLEPHPLIEFYANQLAAGDNIASEILCSAEACLANWQQSVMRSLAVRRRLITSQQKNSVLTPRITSDNLALYIEKLDKALANASSQIELSDPALWAQLNRLKATASSQGPEQLDAVQQIVTWCPVQPALDLTAEAIAHDEELKRSFIAVLDDRKAKLQVTTSQFHREVLHWSRRGNASVYASAATALSTGIAQCAQSFEVIDGDSLKFNHTMVSKLVGDHKVIVVSLVGVQSAGKSTSANHIFHLDCATSVGACTRGVFGAIVPLEEPIGDATALLVLDVEGVSGAGGSDLRSKRLLQFVVAASDIMLVVTKTNVDPHAQALLELAAGELQELQLNADHRLVLGFLFAQAPDRVVRAAYDCPPFSEFDKQEADALVADVAAAIASFNRFSRDAVEIRRSPLLLASKSATDSQLYLRGCRLVRHAIRSMCTAHEIPATHGSVWVGKYSSMWTNCIALMLGFRYVRSMRELDITAALVPIVQEAIGIIDSAHMQPLFLELTLISSAQATLEARVVQLDEFRGKIAETSQRLGLIVKDRSSAAAPEVKGDPIAEVLMRCRWEHGAIPFSDGESEGPVQAALTHLKSQAAMQLQWVDDQREILQRQLTSELQLQRMTAEAMNQLKDSSNQGAKWVEEGRRVVQEKLHEFQTSIAVARSRFRAPLDSPQAFVTLLEPVHGAIVDLLQKARNTFSAVMEAVDKPADAVDTALISACLDSVPDAGRLQCALYGILQQCGRILRDAVTTTSVPEPEQQEQLVLRGRVLLNTLRQYVSSATRAATFRTAAGMLRLLLPWWVFCAVESNTDRVLDMWQQLQVEQFESRLRMSVSTASKSFELCKSVNDVARVFAATVGQRFALEEKAGISAHCFRGLQGCLLARKDLNARFLAEVVATADGTPQQLQWYAAMFARRIIDGSVRHWWYETDFAAAWESQISASRRVAKEQTVARLQQFAQACSDAMVAAQDKTSLDGQRGTLAQLLSSYDPIGHMTQRALAAVFPEAMPSLSDGVLAERFLHAMSIALKQIIDDVQTIFECSWQCDATKNLLPVELGEDVQVALLAKDMKRIRQECANALWSGLQGCIERCPSCGQSCSLPVGDSGHEHYCDIHLWQACTGAATPDTGVASLKLCTDRSLWDSKEEGTLREDSHVWSGWKILPSDCSESAVFKGMLRLWPYMSDAVCEHFHFRDPQRMHENDHTRQWWQWAPEPNWELHERWADICGQIDGFSELPTVGSLTSTFADVTESTWDKLHGLVGENLQIWWREQGAETIAEYYMHHERIRTGDGLDYVPGHSTTRDHHGARLSRQDCLRIRLIVLARFVQNEVCPTNCWDIVLDELRLTLLAFYVLKMYAVGQSAPRARHMLPALQRAALQFGAVFPVGTGATEAWLEASLASESELFVAVYNGHSEFDSYHSCVSGRDAFETAVYCVSNVAVTQQLVNDWVSSVGASSIGALTAKVYRPLQQHATRVTQPRQCAWLHQVPVENVGPHCAYASWIAASQARLVHRWGLPDLWSTLQKFEYRELRQRLGLDQ